MGIESLIPFGLDATSGQLVEVGSVKRGNACGCICPSCKTPLVARHGDEKEWHFAHRSQKVHNETQKECEYSFAVSIRLMIRQLSNNGLKFRTPRFERSMPVFSEYSYESADFGYLVTEESLLILEEVQVGVQFCGVTVDVLGLVKNVPFVVFVTYKERRLPFELKNPSMTKCGVVELNVNVVPRLFKQEKKGQYKEVLRKYIEEGADGKTWAYHPREQRLREAAIGKRQSWLQQQKTEAKAPPNRRHLRESGEPMVFSPAIEDKKPSERSIGKYECVICKRTWEGTSRICKKCNTHLYTTERP
jgi:hypothetical protein